MATLRVENQPLEDGRILKIVRRELRGVFAASRALNRPRSVLPVPDVNGYRDANGVYQEFAKYDTPPGYDGAGMS